jgi:TRAP-type C4-dicarboxylate transport system permease small subunit
MDRRGEAEGGRLDRAVHLLVRGLERVVMVLMGIIVAVVMVEVGLRWLAGGRSLIVTDELTRYLMIWTAMLGAALLVHDDGHIRIAVLADALPKWLARICYYLSQLVVLGFLGMLVVLSLVNLPQLVAQRTITLGVSMAWFVSALPVGGALMFLLVLYDLYRTASGRPNRRPPPGSGA